ncbi:MULTISPECIES: IS110 family transposase [Bacillus]|uniref:IS110 family transposase n=1 Tax=Bacillus TaxID=1386 RepID=UPI0001A0F549|nr:Transposase [Bacillus cereus Rock4-2]
MHNRQNYLYVGVDLHKEHHTAVMINCWQEKLGEIQFDNKSSAFSKFLLEVETYVSDGISVVFGLEDVGGYGRALAKYLVDHERVVKEVNPALLFLERKSQVMIQKNDSWDAECVARILVNKFEQTRCKAKRFILVDTTTSIKKECISKSTKCVKESTTYSIKSPLSKL